MILSQDALLTILMNNVDEFKSLFWKRLLKHIKLIQPLQNIVMHTILKKKNVVLRKTICNMQYVWTYIKVKSCLFSFILYWKIIIIPKVGFVLIFILKSRIIMSREDTYYYLLLLAILLYYFHRHKFGMNFLFKFILMYSIYSTLMYNRESIISFYLKDQN